MGLPSTLEILIAEDNTINQKIILRMLEKLGHHTHVVSNAQAALSAFEEQSYQVILLEAHLFSLDELKQLQQLKHQSSPQTLLIVMRSDPTLDPQLLNQVEIDAFLDKPLKFQSLKSSLVTSSSSTWLDQPTIQALQDVMGEDFPAVWRDLVEGYLQDSEQLVATIKTAICQDNAAQLQQAAHTLKSSSAALGAKSFSQTCFKMENIGRSGQTQAAESLLPTFNTAYNQVKTALRQEQS